MGLIYSGRYKQLSGVVNKISNVVVAPAIMDSTLGWDHLPMYGLNATGGSHLAVSSIKRLPYSDSSYPNVTYTSTASVYVYKLDSEGLPVELIARVPAPNSTMTWGRPTKVNMSPSGKYMAVNWADTSSRKAPDEFVVYEISDTEVTRISTYGAIDILWTANDDMIFLNNYSSDGINPNRGLVIGKPKQFADMLLPLSYAGDAYLLTSKHVVSRCFDRSKPVGERYFQGVFEFDTTTKAVTLVASVPAEMLSDDQFSRTLHAIPEGNNGDAYILCRNTPVDYSKENTLQLYAFSGGQFMKLGDEVPLRKEWFQSITDHGNYHFSNYKVYCTGSAIIFTAQATLGYTAPDQPPVHDTFDRPTKSFAKCFSIDDGLKEIGGDLLNNQVEVLYNRSVNRIISIEHGKAVPYKLTSSGIKVPKPEEPRYSMSLVDSLAMTKQYYPWNPVVDGQLTEVGGVKCANIASIAADSKNYFDFLSEDGIVEFWWKPNGRVGKVFELGNILFYAQQIDSNHSLSLTVGGDGVHVISTTTHINLMTQMVLSGNSHTLLRDNWQHILVATKRHEVLLYVNGQSQPTAKRELIAPDKMRRPPAHMFNNKVMTFGCGYLRDINITKGQVAKLYENVGKSTGFEPQGFEAIRGEPWKVPSGGRFTRV